MKPNLLYLAAGCGLAGLLVFAMPSGPLGAYNISAKGRVHERLAYLSQLCREAGQQAGCDIPADRKALQRVKWKQGKYWRAVRWPDDPTGQINPLGIGKVAVNVGLGGCGNYRNDKGSFSGLLCNSHLGKLQFMHAMRSREAETPAETRALIAAWAGFAFDVASGRQDPQENFCTAIRARGDPLAAALAPEGFPFCEGSETGARPHPAWRVSTLFAMRCRSPISSGTCNELTGDAATAAARDNARGALLHLIEDSYSRSHTARAESKPTGPYQPVIDCLPVREFYFYEDNKKRHSAADSMPEFAASCRAGGAVLDPVTAGAQMLALIERSDDAAQREAVALVMDRVLGGG